MDECNPSTTHTFSSPYGFLFVRLITLSAPIITAISPPCSTEIYRVEIPLPDVFWNFRNFATGSDFFFFFFFLWGIPLWSPSRTIEMGQPTVGPDETPLRRPPLVFACKGKVVTSNKISHGLAISKRCEFAAFQYS